MEESTINEVIFKEGLESLETNDPERISSISVEGYDTRLQAYPLRLALCKHFASCGKRARTVIPRDYKKGILKSPLFIDFWGEAARDKALKLNGTDLGGWNVVVKPVPRQEADYDPARLKHFRRERRVFVKVYDLPSSVREIDVKIGLCEHFSSCGEVTCITVFADGRFDHERTALVSIVGEGCVDKAKEISGQRNAQGWNIVVDSVIPLTAEKRKPTGCEHPSVVLERLNKKAKMEKDKKIKKNKKKTTE